MRNRIKPLRLILPVHRATHRIGLYVQATGLGVTQGEAHVLAHLAASGPSAIGELHDAFAHRRSTLTGILDRLEARGLLRRAVRPEDRRSFLVTPTARGRALARRVHAALAALESAVAAHVPPGAVAGFETVLRALEETARRRAARGAR